MTPHESEVMRSAKKNLWAIWSKKYGNDVWGCGIGAGPDGSLNPHLRLYVTREDIKTHVLNSTPHINSFPVHVIVESGPSATGTVPGDLLS